MSTTIFELKDKFGNRPRLAGFFNFAAQLSPSLEYVEVDYNPCNPDEVAKKRSVFLDPKFKQSMYRKFGTDYGTELNLMGIPNAQIDRMILYGLRPNAEDGTRLDFTVDHILSLSLGGTNQFNNLCFLPGKINHFKNILETLQSTDNKGKIITIMPKFVGGKRSGVPIMDQRYAIRTSNVTMEI